MSKNDDYSTDSESGLVYVRYFRTKTGRIIYASSYGKKCFVFKAKKKA